MVRRTPNRVPKTRLDYRPRQDVTTLEKKRPESREPLELRSAVHPGRVDGHGAFVLSPPAANRIEMFECKSQWIHLTVAGATNRILTVHCQPFSHRSRLTAFAL